MTWPADEGVSGAVPPESRKRFKTALALLEAGESRSVPSSDPGLAATLALGARPQSLSGEVGVC
jgi:hypothetical protein